VWPGLETDALGDYAHISIDRQLYSDTAIFKTAYWFTDRFYVFVDPTPDNRVSIELRPKSASSHVDLQGACGEFCNSLVDYRVRGLVLNETSVVRDALVAKAFMEGIPKPAEGDIHPTLSDIS
jgi:His-Xaa-Ser system protein HxsD